MPKWFKRTEEADKSVEKRSIPHGVWIKCEGCGATLYRKELQRSLLVCPKCNYHFRMPSEEYIKLLLDDKSWKEWDTHLTTADPLEFVDSVSYKSRAEKNAKKAKLPEALRCLSGRLDDRAVELAILDFGFMGGSVGSVVGEKLARAINRAIAHRSPLITVACSGGMRMQEGLYSLMQMAKVSAMLVNLSRANIPFISLLTNPTTGGTTASFAMLGDINISEPKALIGFAGPRVIKQTIGQELPEGFQSAEFVLEKGFLDLIVERKQLKQKISSLLSLLTDGK